MTGVYARHMHSRGVDYAQRDDSRRLEDRVSIISRCISQATLLDRALLAQMIFKTKIHSRARPLPCQLQARMRRYFSPPRHARSSALLSPMPPCGRSTRAWAECGRRAMPRITFIRRRKKATLPRCRCSIDVSSHAAGHGERAEAIRFELLIAFLRDA